MILLQFQIVLQTAESQKIRLKRIPIRNVKIEKLKTLPNELKKSLFFIPPFQINKNESLLL